jgi:hypothetical protein
MGSPRTSTGADVTVPGSDPTLGPPEWRPPAWWSPATDLETTGSWGRPVASGRPTYGAWGDPGRSRAGNGASPGSVEETVRAPGPRRWTVAKIGRGPLNGLTLGGPPEPPGPPTAIGRTPGSAGPVAGARCSEIGGAAASGAPRPGRRGAAGAPAAGGEAPGRSDDDGGGSNAGGGALVALLAGNAVDGAPTGSARVVWTFVRRPEGRSASRGAAIAALVSDRDGASASEPGATTGS